MHDQIINTAAATVHPKPFVKWAGGKRQLLPVLSGSMPLSFNRYFEPFLGGGAFFFHIIMAMKATQDTHAYHISDLNPDLILSYCTIRDHVDDLIKSLKGHDIKYRAGSELYYYHVRDTYDAKNADAIETVSRLIFLNKTCFNGLYRVNSKGKFNVPLGRYVNPSIVNVDNLVAVSNVLNAHDVNITCQDFETLLINNARKGDFVYFDPPYLPVSTTANFTKYTGGDFGFDDQKRLADLCVRLNEIGCYVLLSNSDSGVISDMFASDDWTVERVDASRRINSDSSKRHGHKELLIKNY